MKKLISAMAEVPDGEMEDELLVQVEGLRTYISTPTGMVRAVDGVDLNVRKGKVLGILGESGSGKSVMARSILGLADNFPGVIEGRILFRDKGKVENLAHPLEETTLVELGSDGEICKISKDMKAWRKQIQETYRGIWGRKISMIFQDPQKSLNPFWTVGEQLVETVENGTSANMPETIRKWQDVVKWLKKVRIKKADDVIEAYPHNLSGGMCQRVMIAMALGGHPSLVIADEPTTGLDATVQAQIVNLLKSLQKRYGTTIIVISHDIGMISRLADDIAVMYCGQIVEHGPRKRMVDPQVEQKHPYTKALLESLLSVNCDPMRRMEGLRAIEKEVPDPKNPPPGCRFHPRCQVYQNWRTQEGDRGAGTRWLAQCPLKEPPLVKTAESSGIRCWHFYDEPDEESSHV